VTGGAALLALGKRERASARVLRDGVVELAGEAANGFVTRGTNRLVELLRRCLHDPGCLALERSREPLGLSPRDLREAAGEPLGRVDLLALDLLTELALASP
jgi:hypothetical protein